MEKNYIGSLGKNHRRGLIEMYVGYGPSPKENNWLVSTLSQNLAQFEMVKIIMIIFPLAILHLPLVP